MKKRWLVICLVAVVLQVGVTRCTSEINKLQWSEQGLKEELRIVYEENSSLREQLVAAERRAVSEEIANPVENADLPENEDIPIIEGAKLDLMDKGYAERIRSTMSADEMVVLGVYPVGEDSEKSMKRFFLCDGRYYAEFYLVDYITGEIINLSRRNPCIDVSYLVRDDDDQLINAYYDWGICIEDYDGNGEPDILLVLSFPEKGSGFSRTGGVLMWLQKQGSFLPVNRSYCGYYSKWRESEFSVKIEELEDKLREGQNPDDWSIDKVGAWVREELLEGQMESLDKELENPKKQLSYDQWREPRNLHPELVQDAQEHYSVRIEGNPYSENQINEWLKDFY